MDERQSGSWLSYAMARCRNDESRERLLLKILALKLADGSVTLTERQSFLGKAGRQSQG